MKNTNLPANNDFLHEVALDMKRLNNTTGGAWALPLSEFVDDLKKMGEARILRSSFRGMRQI